MEKYEFIYKALFFPEKEILAIGDLHIGYDYMLKQSGVLVPKRQVNDIIEDLTKIFKKIESKKNKVKKIIFLGDIKHSFGYEFSERDELNEIMAFLKKKIPEEKNIIFIKGNHDTMDYTPKKNMKKSHLESGIFFTHGHESSLDIFDDEVEIVVSGHLHPSVALAEEKGAKREVFKCFLEGKSGSKNFIVLPSFLSFVEGTLINEYREDYVESFSIIPKKDMMKFKVHIIGDDGVLDFGKVGDL